MFDRHWLGDIALAVLLVLPLTGLARWQPDTHQTGREIAAANLGAGQSPEGRIGLLG